MFCFMMKKRERNILHNVILFHLSKCFDLKGYSSFLNKFMTLVIPVSYLNERDPGIFKISLEIY